MASDIPRPPYDEELALVLAAIPFPQPLTLELVAQLQANPSLMGGPSVAEIIGGRPIAHTERRIPGLEPSDPEITLSIFTPKGDAKGPRPCVYWIHGGGMVICDRFSGVQYPLGWVADTDAVVISVEYRLAPSNPDPALRNDCYAGLSWVSKHSQELGIDAERIMIAGQSAGAGIAAGVTLMCRDLKGPKLCAQYLSCPMLDDRNTTVSSKQFLTEGTWVRDSNIMAWKAVLGEKVGTADVSIYAAPARAEDLSGLPTTFVDVGSAELFRDEDVAYASKIWAAGGQVELHVYAGAFHGFDMFAPTSRLGVLASTTQKTWVKNVFASTKGSATRAPETVSTSDTLAAL